VEDSVRACRRAADQIEVAITVHIPHCHAGHAIGCTAEGYRFRKVAGAIIEIDHARVVRANHGYIQSAISVAIADCKGEHVVIGIAKRLFSGEITTPGVEIEVIAILIPRNDIHIAITIHIPNSDS